MTVSHASVPSFGRDAPPELERRPFDRDLWARLETMEIDPPDAATRFRHRLKQYNTWTDEFAARVTKEYRRFLYLAARAGHPVTPSDTVDQAWHLHLIYTRHYWEELCGRILELQLHHEPSAGGTVESNRFERQYEQTIASYKAAFGEAPPADIWPAREPAKRGALGMKFLVAGATVVGMAIALKAANVALLIVVAIVVSSPTDTSRPLRTTRASAAVAAAVAAARREAAVTLPRPAAVAQAAVVAAGAVAAGAAAAAARRTRPPRNVIERLSTSKVSPLSRAAHSSRGALLAGELPLNHPADPSIDLTTP